MLYITVKVIIQTTMDNGHEYCYSHDINGEINLEAFRKIWAFAWISCYLGQQDLDSQQKYY